MLETSTLSLGSEESIEIHYEPHISHHAPYGPISSTFPSTRQGKIPDFLLHYRAGETEKIGIFDAKFGGDETIEKSSQDIYTKYGLYFCKNNSQPIDYVVSLYPEKAQATRALKNYRKGQHSEEILPFLGIMSLPVTHDKKRIDDFYVELKKLVKSQDITAQYQKEQQQSI